MRLYCFDILPFDSMNEDVHIVEAPNQHMAWVVCKAVYPNACCVMRVESYDLPDMQCE